VVGFIIVGLFLLALVVFVAYSYWKPGPEQGQPGTSLDAREGEQW
jgi:hypothetical protein